MQPYLHESRHLHALNRVRGSGGRFLRTKSDQKPDPNPTTDTHGIPRSLPSSQHVVDLPKLEPETGKCGAMSIPSCSGITSVTNSDVIFWQPDRGFLATSHGARHCAPVVRWEVGMSSPSPAGQFILGFIFNCSVIVIIIITIITRSVRRRMYWISLPSFVSCARLGMFWMRSRFWCP